jgi:hypothetical protein
MVARRSLIVQHFENFKGYKIKVESYLDGKNPAKGNVKDSKEISEIDNLVIQVDSINKIYREDFSDTFVYLDEAHSTIEYLLTSSTMSKNRQQNYLKMCQILRTAKYVIACDADLSDLVIRFIADLRDQKKTVFILKNSKIIKN